jgi:hypothetical protein
MVAQDEHLKMIADWKVDGLWIHLWVSSWNHMGLCWPRNPFVISQGAKIDCIHSLLVHVTSAKPPQITPFLDINEVLGGCKT